MRACVRACMYVSMMAHARGKVFWLLRFFLSFTFIENVGPWFGFVCLCESVCVRVCMCVCIGVYEPRCARLPCPCMHTCYSCGSVFAFASASVHLFMWLQG